MDQLNRTSGKYAYKEDEKGMADNASSIVSCVANGCITFTSLGALTPLDFIQSREGERFSFKKLTPPRAEDATPEFVFEQICLREESPHLNLRSYEAMKRAIETRFEPGRVATQHCLVDLDLLS
ncbi:hypothetical protein [Myxococcus stipitatus]|uniref:hypothetical protein n=1 Tax=Myxococcus stipitatus TaxID=83455 RepID=UPI0030D32595